MTESMDIFEKLSRAEEVTPVVVEESFSSERERRINEHKAWLKNIRHERPNPAKAFRVGIYIRYFNQTRYDNYLEYHVKQYEDSMALCPNWETVGFYIDNGASAPNMESAPEWSRLLQDCFDGKVDLIITQKISNVSKKAHEVTLLARILAAREKPVGIYFLSEDIYTLASYYQHDLRDTMFFPDEGWQILPEPDEQDQNFLRAGENLDDQCRE